MKLTLFFLLISSFCFSQTLIKAEKKSLRSKDENLVTKHYYIELKKPSGNLFQLDSIQTPSGEKLKFDLSRSDENGNRVCNSLMCTDAETIIVVMQHQENMLNKKQRRILATPNEDYTDGVIMYYRNGDHLKRLVVKTFTEVPPNQGTPISTTGE